MEQHDKLLQEISEEHTLKHVENVHDTSQPAIDPGNFASKSLSISSASQRQSYPASCPGGLAADKDSRQAFDQDVGVSTDV